MSDPRDITDPGECLVNAADVSGGPGLAVTPGAGHDGGCTTVPARAMAPTPFVKLSIRAVQVNPRAL